MCQRIVKENVESNVANNANVTKNGKEMKTMKKTVKKTVRTNVEKAVEAMNKYDKDFATLDWEELSQNKCKATTLFHVDVDAYILKLFPNRRYESNGSRKLNLMSTSVPVINLSTGEISPTITFRTQPANHQMSRALLYTYNKEKQAIRRSATNHKAVRRGYKGQLVAGTMPEYQGCTYMYISDFLQTQGGIDYIESVLTAMKEEGFTDYNDYRRKHYPASELYYLPKEEYYKKMGVSTSKPTVSEAMLKDIAAQVAALTKTLKEAGVM